MIDTAVHWAAPGQDWDELRPPALIRWPGPQAY